MIAAAGHPLGRKGGIVQKLRRQSPPSRPRPQPERRALTVLQRKNAIAIPTFCFQIAGAKTAKEISMGLGPPILALYRQLKLGGTFDGIDRVVELGSQGVWCPDQRLLNGLFEAFGRPLPRAAELDAYISKAGTGHAPSRHLHESLGFQYDCV